MNTDKWEVTVKVVPTLGLLAALSLIVLQCVYARLERPSPFELAVNALVYDLAIWGCAAGTALCIYMAVSLAETAVLVRASLRATAAAMWLLPSVLLLSARTTFTTVVGLLLLANTVRLLASRSAPRGQESTNPHKHRTLHHRMFRSADLRPATFRERLPALTVAIALQACVWIALAGYPMRAAIFLAIGVTVWTRSLRLPSDKKDPWRSPLGMLATLALTVALSLGQLRIEAQTPANDSLFEPTAQVLFRLSHAPKPKPAPKAAAKRPATPVFTPPKAAGTLVAGVILRPESEAAPQRRRVFGGPLLPATALSLTDPLTIPFTGEYHLYRTSSVRLPREAAIEDSTPLTSLYTTTNGEPMQMEALQILSPPMYIKNCRSIQMILASRETLPGIVFMQFLTAGKEEEAGIAVFGLSGSPEEIINFTIAPGSVEHPITGIRVIFQHNPTNSAQNSRIAIQRFTFSPNIPATSGQ